MVEGKQREEVMVALKKIYGEKASVLDGIKVKC